MQKLVNVMKHIFLTITLILTQKMIFRHFASMVLF